VDKPDTSESRQRWVNTLNEQYGEAWGEAMKEFARRAPRVVGVVWDDRHFAYFRRWLESPPGESGGIVRRRIIDEIEDKLPVLPGNYRQVIRDIEDGSRLLTEPGVAVGRNPALTRGVYKIRLALQALGISNLPPAPTIDLSPAEAAAHLESLRMILGQKLAAEPLPTNEASPPRREAPGIAHPVDMPTHLALTEIWTAYSWLSGAARDRVRKSLDVRVSGAGLGSTTRDTGKRREKTYPAQIVRETVEAEYKKHGE
jgi:hypothetical protein